MNRIIIILGIIILITGVSMLSYSFYQDNKYKNEDKELLNEFFENYEEEKGLEQIDIKEKFISQENFKRYDGVIEIPKISLKTGIVKSDNDYSTMNRYVSIHPKSDMPDYENGNLILFAHNGNSRVSYFKNIYKLNKDDKIFIYYNNQKYTYKVINKYDVYMMDNIPLNRIEDKNIVTLITCKKGNRDYRTIIVGELVV